MCSEEARRRRKRVVVLALALGSLVVAGDVSADGVSESSGAFLRAIAIRVPAFRGLEPRLVLGYSSQGGSGFAGVGWGWAVASASSNASAPASGRPISTAPDIYALDGRELLPCPAPNPRGPSCTSGGTHTTKVESYLKIRLQGTTWTVWSRDGTQTIYTPVYPTPSGTLRWGQTRHAIRHPQQHRELLLDLPRHRRLLSGEGRVRSLPGRGEPRGSAGCA